jgi:hypothetical protein
VELNYYLAMREENELKVLEKRALKKIKVHCRIYVMEDVIICVSVASQET